MLILLIMFFFPQFVNVENQERASLFEIMFLL